MDGNGRKETKERKKRVRDKYTEEIKVPIFWDITLCSPLKANRRFGGTCFLQLQDRGVSQSRNQHEAGSYQT
jgi:hypothetical protein